MSIYFYIFFYKKSWNSINDKLYPSGSALACIYGTPKMHKFSSSDSFPKPRLILSSIGTSNYNIARFLCNILSPLVPNDYSCNDTFYFVSQIRNANLSKIFLVSYDITCLLTNIPLPNFLNNRQRNIKFTVEKKIIYSIAFLDVFVSGINTQNLTFQAYHKSTYTWLLLNFKSFTSFWYKIRLIKCLIDRFLTFVTIGTP